ncbi:L-type lectin-domain containing receptor kinase VIII.1-like [Rutidosis leptorrhynchoides]|uniref:L-type lectin-domain containing receptor kinase VIII.1-like n=1 Tax=Rutidosis leptorrhynchoides TaxID=125765 RepID=UPI003A99C7D2
MPSFSRRTSIHIFRSYFLTFIIIVIIVINFPINASAETISFDFQSLSLNTLILLGDAHFTNTSIILTRELTVPTSGSGAVLYKKPVRFKRPGSETLTSFSSFFSFSISNLNPDSIGGGLAFVVAATDETVGSPGGYLGVPTGAVGIEFDTLMDVQFQDINGNHLGLDLNSTVSKYVADLDSFNVDLKSGDQVNSWVEFNGSTGRINVSVSYSNIKPSSPVLSVVLDLNKYVNEFMFVGFTGSTQGSTEVHSVEWWKFNSSFDDVAPRPPPPSVNLTNPSADSVNPLPPSIAPTESTRVRHHTQKKSKCSNSLCKEGAGAVVGVVTASAFVLVLCTVFMVWVYSKKFKKSKKSHLFDTEIIKAPKEFFYKELKVATKSFDPARVIGHGAFGTVYRGVLSDSGEVVAVKRCSHSGGQGMSEFLSELSIIGTLRHRNLVRLQGWCHERGEILLVYDLMPNGSLDKALFESKLVLPWIHRSKILMGVASALAYLHQECENQVIHRDVKSSNIMLDEGFNARLGDFGLARRTEHDKSPDATVAAGTMGYLAPEYLLTGRASEKTDVFSYGAVVLEVATGRRPIEKEIGPGKVRDNSNLVEWVWGLHKAGRLLNAADPRLCGEFDEVEMRKVLLIGLVCSHPDPEVRPTMRNVVQMLVGEADVPVVPKAKPSMSFSTSHLLLNLQDSVSDLNEFVTVSTSSSEHSFNGGGLDLV